MKTIKTETVRPARFVEQFDGDPCFLCGRATKGKFWIFVLNGGDDLACETPGLSEEEAAHGNLVVHPVGPACAKRITKAGGLVTKWDDKLQDLL